MLGILRRHRLLLLALVVIGGLAGWGLSRLQPLTYTAEALLVVGRDVNTPLPAEAAEVPPRWLVATERDILASRSMIEAGLERVGTPPPPGPPGAFDRIGEWVGERLGLGASEAEPAEPAPPPTGAALARQVGGGLAIEAAPGSLVMSVSHSGPAPEFSARFVNALVEAYIDQKEADFAGSRTSALRGMEERLLGYDEGIAEAVEDISDMLTEPDTQLSLQRRRRELGALQNLTEVIELQRERIALRPDADRVWFVSPAAVPLRPELAGRRLTVAAGLVLPAGIAAVLIVFGTRLSAAAAARRAPAPRMREEEPLLLTSPVRFGRR